MKTNQQIINAKSFRERLLLKKELLDLIPHPSIQHIEYTPYDGTDKYDATWDELYEVINGKYAAHKVICEVKIRNYPMTAYNTWYIQKDKYDYLMAQTQYDKKLYINIHQDGIQIFNLSKISEPEWKQQTLPTNNQSDDTISKIKGDLHSKDAEKIVKKIDIHQALQKSFEILEKRGK